MAKVEQEPLSRERFENNADRLIFPDRHEYRTRSRAEHFVYGIICLALLAMLIALPLWTIFSVAPAAGLQFAGQIRMFGYVSGTLFLLISPMFVWFAFCLFFFHPRLVISPHGLDFVEWMPTARIQFRLNNFRVDFADITAIEGFTRGEAGQRGNRASTFHHGVELCAEGRSCLRLPWTAYKKEEAEKFKTAFVESIQEMVTRMQAAPYR